MVLEVLEQGLVGRQRAGPHRGPVDLAQDDLLVGQLSSTEQRPEAALSLDLHDERREPGPGRQQREGGRDRRLAHAALPGHDDQSGLRVEARRVHPFLPRRLVDPISARRLDTSHRVLVPRALVARARGRLGGRPKALPAEKRQWAVQLYQEKKIAVKHICELMGISKPTLYAYVRQTQSSS